MRQKSEAFSFINDLAKMAGGAVHALPDLRGQIKDMVRDAVGQIVDRMDLVTRKEFDRVEAIAMKARLKNDELEKRLSALEKKDVKKEKKSSPKAAAKTAPKAKAKKRK